MNIDMKTTVTSGGEFKGRRCWSMEDVANEVAEKYWDNEDRKTQMILCLK